MSNSSRRFEILLPQKFNDGEPVPKNLIFDTLDEIRQRFGAVSWETQVIHGMWQQGKIEFSDDLVRIFVDVPDEPESRQFFTDFKEQLKARFRQLEIYTTTYPIDVL
jgi:hypothetical protein